MNAHNILYHNNWYNCTRHDYKINRYITFAVLSQILKHYIFFILAKFRITFRGNEVISKAIDICPGVYESENKMPRLNSGLYDMQYAS